MRTTRCLPRALTTCLLSLGSLLFMGAEAFIHVPRVRTVSVGPLFSAAIPESPPPLQDLAMDGTTRDGLKAALLDTLGAPKVADAVLACPVSLRPLTSKVALAGPFVSIEYKVCSTYGTLYRVNDVYADLVPQDEKATPFWRLSPREIGTQELFRSPLTSFLYERGWRQNFNAAGFPGIDKEATEVLDFFQGAATGGTIVDLSCGSGLMTRRLVKSGQFQRVIAADYSESMLRETARRFRLEGLDTPELIRCDAARLPFQTGSVDAIHAGAALHCWPALEDSLREVYRVLKPGGRFYASTFEAGYMGTRANSRNSFRFFQLNELKSLLIDSGFPVTDVDVRREGTACLIAKCVKAPSEQQPPPAAAAQGEQP